MDLRPGNDESFLSAGQYASDRFDRVDGKDADPVLVVGMEMRAVVRPSCLDEHSDNDAEETADLGHSVRVWCLRSDKWCPIGNDELSKTIPISTPVSIAADRISGSPCR